LDEDNGNLIWCYKTEGYPQGSPAVADGKVFVVGSTDTKIYCLDEYTGKLIWDYDAGEMDPREGSGFSHTSPTVSDGKVFVGSDDHKIYCIDENTGKLIWSHETGSFVRSSPAVADGKIFIGSHDGIIRCLDEDMGSLIWSYEPVGAYCSPAVVNGNVFIYGIDEENNSGIICLDEDTGNLIRSYNIEEGGIGSSPAVADGKVFVGSWDNKIYCFDEDSANLIWSYETGDTVVSSPAVADGKVFVGSNDHNTYCLDATSGNLIWSYNTGTFAESSPAISNGKVFVGGDKIYGFGAKSTSKPMPISTAVPTSTPEEPTTSTRSPFDSSPPLYIICAAILIVIILITGICISRKRKGGNSGPSIPQPPAEPPKPKTEPILQKPTIEPVSIKEPRIEISSAFGYKGATILYKIKVNNSTPEPISDIRVSLFVPDVFLLREKEKSIVMLEPHESNTVTFTIRPTGECGDCNVSGKVNYYDYSTKKRQEVDIHAKSLSIVCPMLKAKQIDKAAWKDTVSRLIKAEESTKEIQIPAETLFNMASRVVEDMNMFSLEPEVTSTPQLFNGVARFYSEGVKELKYAAQIEVVGGTKKSKLILKVWAEKEEALTGFYHGILDEIEKRVQVKGYIEDSIVQQFYHIGDRIGSVVKDSVVQRSTIGRVKNCPSCGREVSGDERFCPDCGAELK
jgi:outer membrane protein assembly factor BamB